MIAYALDVLGAMARDVLMVGDRRHDVLGAAAHGIKTVGVLYGYGGEKELSEAGAVALAADAKELYKCIKQV